MPTNHRGRQAQDLAVRVIIPRTVEQRLKRIEDLLLEMRHEQDVLLKMLTKTQAQVDALPGEVAERRAPKEPFQTEPMNPR